MDLWKIDTTSKGIDAVFIPYQWEIITEISRSKKEWTSRKMHEQLNKGEQKISRASVINYLELLAENGIINKKEKSGKGGYHGVYSKGLDYQQVITRIILDLTLTLKEAFPDGDYFKGP